jgi:hypothetical protein
MLYMPPVIEIAPAVVAVHGADTITVFSAAASAGWKFVGSNEPAFKPETIVPPKKTFPSARMARVSPVAPILIDIMDVNPRLFTGIEPPPPHVQTVPSDFNAMDVEPPAET